MNRFQFTEREKAIIKDVHRKNFWTRALPLSLGCMVGCRALMTRGYIGTNRGLAKVLGCGLVGFLMGKINTTVQMKESLLRECPDGVFATMYKLPPEERNKVLADLTEEMRGISRQDTSPKLTGETTAQARNESVSHTTSPSTLPMALSSHAESSVVKDELPPTTQQPVFSYAEQRTKWNKSETGTPTSSQSFPQPEFSYAQQRSSNSGDSSQKLPQETVQAEIPVTGKVRRNKYGDEME